MTLHPFKYKYLRRDCSLTNCLILSAFVDKYSWGSSAENRKCMQCFLVILPKDLSTVVLVFIPGELFD